MRNSKFSLFAVAVLVILLMLAACGQATTDDDPNSEGGSFSGTSVSEDNFIWDDNIIVALSEDGCKQNSIVIPKRCEGFSGAIFSDSDNNVTAVTFEDNKDIRLNGVFTGADKIKTISLPGNLTEIENMDFWLCESLEKIIIPDTVLRIGEAAFQDCISLKAVVLGENITEIDDYAFDGCTALAEFNLVDSVSVIGEYAFYECTSLNTVHLPTNANSIGAFAFANSGLTDLYIPAEVQFNEYDATSFVQAQNTVTIHVVSGSWAELNFDTVFGAGFTKSIE